MVDIAWLLQSHGAGKRNVLLLGRIARNDDKRDAKRGQGVRRRDRTDACQVGVEDGGITGALGNEGKGLSRLVTETCDAVVSIPIEAATESLNAGIAVSVALYEISRLRAAK